MIERDRFKGTVSLRFLPGSSAAASHICTVKIVCNTHMFWHIWCRQLCLMWRSLVLWLKGRLSACALSLDLHWIDFKQASAETGTLALVSLIIILIILIYLHVHIKFQHEHAKRPTPPHRQCFTCDMWNDHMGEMWCTRFSPSVADVSVVMWYFLNCR